MANGLLTATTNSLSHGPPFTTEKVTKKWFDLMRRAKKDVAMYKKEAGRTGGDQNPFITPTELQFKIAKIMAPYLRKVFHCSWNKFMRH